MDSILINVIGLILAFACLLILIYVFLSTSKKKKADTDFSYDEVPRMSFSESARTLAEGIHVIYKKETGHILRNHVIKPEFRDIIFIWTSYYVLFKYITEPFLINDKLITVFLDHICEDISNEAERQRYRNAVSKIIKDLVPDYEDFFHMFQCKPEDLQSDETLLLIYAEYISAFDVKDKEKYQIDYLESAKRVYNVLSQVFL